MSDSTLKPIGRASSHLGPDEAREWRRVINSLPEGTLAEADRAALEIYCGQVVRLRQGMETTAAELAHLRLLMGDLGLTPTSRRRLQIRAEKETHDPFDELLARRKAREVKAP